MGSSRKGASFFADLRVASYAVDLRAVRSTSPEVRERVSGPVADRFVKHADSVIDADANVTNEDTRRFLRNFVGRYEDRARRRLTL